MRNIINETEKNQFIKPVAVQSMQRSISWNAA